MVEIINSKDISVVVQGAIDQKLTSKCVKSIRKYLPDAEIILSTWEGSDVSGLDFDVLVLNQDPGGYKHDFAIYNRSRSLNNFNRQLISTRNGIEKVSNKYCLKLRSDLLLNNSDFLKYWDNFKVQNENFKIFKHRVLCSSLYSREYSCQSGTGLPTPFHPSDFWFFGLTNDLKDYFGNCPLQSVEEACNWDFKYPNRLPYLLMLWRFAPEQYFCVNWIKKYYPHLQFNDWSDWNPENMELSNNILYNNFVFLGLEESGIYSTKHLEAEKIKNNIQGLITYSYFQEKYKEYCDSEYKPKKTKKIYKYKLIIHVNKFLKPFIQIKKWCGEIFSILYYLAMLILSILVRRKSND